MDYKKVRTENSAITRKLRDFSKETGNVYETLVILSKRANQISLEMRDELKRRLTSLPQPIQTLRRYLKTGSK